jgi:hypothetical protein
MFAGSLMRNRFAGIGLSHTSLDLGQEYEPFYGVFEGRVRRELLDGFESLFLICH